MTNNLKKLFENLPGSDLVLSGLEDLDKGIVSENSLLVLVAGPSLRNLGITVSEKPELMPYEHQLYLFIGRQSGKDCHSYYNSLIRRVVSFRQALDSRVG